MTKDGGMTRDQLLAMLGRKSVTWLSGFCAAVWIVAKWPGWFTPENVTAIAAAALLAASAKLSADNETKPKGPKPA